MRIDVIALPDNLYDTFTIDLFESLPSTNDTCLEKITRPNAGEKIPVVLADRQTAGRGRLQRTWYSPAGENLYLSCGFVFDNDFSALSGLSLVVGLAVRASIIQMQEKIFGEDREILRQAQDNHIKLKWPNDLYYKNAKLGGILIELAKTHDDKQGAVVGIGLNVNMTTAHGLNHDWTSLQKIYGNRFDRTALTATLLSTLHYYIVQFRHSGFAEFIKEYTAHDYLLGKNIVLENGAQNIEGTVTGVDPVGRICVRLGDIVKAFSAGTIKVV